ncbi:hypothetical protein PAEPH01_2782 [Pancytospora epiphaga]|nr:hypothetical protein PAEPH01_2782 [Pancytospora epiphaga]
MFRSAKRFIATIELLFMEHHRVYRIIFLIYRQLILATRECFQLSQFMSNIKKLPIVKRYELIDSRKGEHWAENMSCLKHTDTSITFPLENSFVIVTDIVGSTQLYNDDPIHMKSQMDIHNTIVKRLVRVFGGHIVANEGDSFALAFSNIYGALNFGLNFIDQLDEHNVEFQVRMGVNSGKMWARNLCGYKLFGGPVEEITGFIRHSSKTMMCIKKELLKSYCIYPIKGFCIH